jgi:hypothetical protein
VTLDYTHKWNISSVIDQLPAPSRIWEYPQLTAGKFKGSRTTVGIKDRNTAILSAFLSTQNKSNSVSINLVKVFTSL